MSHSKVVITPPRINLRRAKSYNHDRGPLSSTSSRFHFNHLVFSPPPSPGLPSLSPPAKKPTRRLFGTIRPLRAILVLTWLFGEPAPAPTEPAKPVITKEADTGMVSQKGVPDFPTPIVVTDDRGRAKWTVFIPPGSEFPLAMNQYADMCLKCRQVAQRTRHLRSHKHGLHQVSFGFSSDSASDFVDVQEAETAGYLPGVGENNGGGPAGGSVSDKPVCKKSLTFTLMMLWVAYGLAEKEGRAFFYTSIFQPPPLPECLAPPSHERLPCPRHARHLVASAATMDESHDRALRMTQFNLARRGYEALSRLNSDDADYVDTRVRELLAKRIVPKSRGQRSGLAVGVHVRRGDRHPLEYQYRHSYMPLNLYGDTAREVVDAKLNHTGPLGGADEAAKAQSIVVLASDDPMAYESAELAGASRAQERIKLASKQTIQKVNPDKSVMHKFVDETFGWEGGFFAAMFWNLGVSTGSGSSSSTTPAPSAETLRLRSLVGRAYMMDLAVLADASDVIVCTVSAVGCRLLAGNWDVAGPLAEGFSRLGLASQIAVSFGGFLFLSVFLNVLSQVLFKDPNVPPVVFHWFPVVGSTITYGMDPPRFFKENKEKYGDCFTFILLGKKTTVYLGVKGNDFILNGKIRDVCAEEIYTVLTTPVFGKDVVYDCPNSKLMEQKKFMKIALTTEAFRSYVPIISDEVTSYFKRTPDFKGQSGVVNICPKMAQITIFTASHALQGKEIRDKFDVALADLYHDLDMGFSPINFMLHWAPLPWNNRRDHAQRTVAKIYMDTIKSRRERAENDALDMMHHLMGSTYKNGVPVPDHEIAHIMIALLMAGQHSSSSTSSWIMLRLAARPDIMEDLYQEQVKNLGADLPPLQYEDLAKLPLNQAIIKETLRLNAPIHSIMRAVKQPMPVPGTKFVIPTNHVLLAAPGVTGADEQYFPQPDLWEPHRWFKDSPLAPSMVRNAQDQANDEEADDEKIDYGYGLVSKGSSSPYLPFGAGRHRCIGEHFANVQLQTIVAMTVRLFKFRNVDGSNDVIGTDYASLFSRPLEPANIHWEKRD
ncbi:cytochrome P450 [Chaetomidium leptoderma]|uniref:Cytochrome P450 n=1 Tax=Chaetomidium leptoderma TaxID=669021 RepID=A0AAN6ZWN6_9PEZI|nr:cytochrome P450 [Chaetomidium leptoderma]